MAFTAQQVQQILQRAAEVEYATPSAQADPQRRGADWLEDAYLHETRESQPTASSPVRDRA